MNLYVYRYMYVHVYTFKAALQAPNAPRRPDVMCV